MYTINTDLSSRLIRVTVNSFLNVMEGTQAIAEIKREIARFKGNGFYMLLDFRAASVVPPEVTDQWLELAQYARSAGMIKSARLISTASTKMQLNYVARSAHYDDVVENFTDERSALKWLGISEKPEAAKDEKKATPSSQRNRGFRP